MNPIAALRARLRGRSDSEHEQAILRIFIFALVLAYMGATYSPNQVSGGHGELLLLQGLTATLLLALALFVAICIWPAPNVQRRVVGMVADAGAATFVMFLTGESGVSMVGVYLFVIFGNGFRYGRRYLFACQALCLIGFYGVLQFVPFWQVHAVAGWCLMLALIVLPLYVATLLKRIEESRARAEQALKECLARERASV